ncbi:hypothetical protein T265_10202 [Opisthorchis viverrini]|uniref:Uncharacterized protein n=1 Tax=Opisthorchis viverrini TaxID=6198 RepID=A0A074ZE60_OPIVI|nr:hypothetical protein T265_10202 [Opisthorchis viverrini]KER21490.1 hypothetical protein T265_10202 [Opisthorchis viverrini]
MNPRANRCKCNRLGILATQHRVANTSLENIAQDSSLARLICGPHVPDHSSGKVRKFINIKMQITVDKNLSIWDRDEDDKQEYEDPLKPIDTDR